MERLDEKTAKNAQILNHLDVFHTIFARPRSSMDRVTDFESGGKYLIRRLGAENRVVGSLQGPIFGGFLPLSIHKLSEGRPSVDLAGVEMPTSTVLT